ncbi:hypothetical protein CLOSTMETH_02236 [[Clostridium] methylpentosum DSM 5476]|uniref:Uncharacterized protein n=1 Tax=[Clostridium] methylpentosum DSM 5476 TaxID=537013 RepID=C0EEF0_9FIRM|nr:hypothetical protein CLOSTMETH_02236 [[Clostridium] methylpentosum DSM 5476]
MARCIWPICVWNGSAICWAAATDQKTVRSNQIIQNDLIPSYVNTENRNSRSFHKSILIA